MREFFSVVAVPTPKRDIDLLGPKTWRIDGAREPGGAGVPVVYLSAYVDQPGAFAERLRAFLAADEPRPAARPAPSEEIGPYSLPQFVEDVDFSERLFLPDDLNATDWKAWAEAIQRRVNLATSSDQLELLEGENQTGLRACPQGLRAAIGRNLRNRYVETESQAA
ncbi:hypothetical protein ACFPIF_10370 [Brevundimonas faecalis]|uniref:hypothetical protein n=1 Tax=Brevundimonas faecalis TaxID=947378 RepID=UPI003618A908